MILTNLIAIFIFTMPAGMSIRASLLGIVAGFFPIGWIVLNVIFLYQLTVATGQFELLKRAVGGVTEDRRLQLLADRVFVRRVLRRRLGLRYAGRRSPARS